MNKIFEPVDLVVSEQRKTGKALAVILAGHNGSGKSTMWRRYLSNHLKIPLVNADRMMLSILPEPGNDGALEPWAQTLRDTDEGWMKVAQDGVQAFVGHAMQAQVPFAMETVFSYWEERPDGTVESKIDLIRDLQAAGYFVLLLFVGLTNSDLSVLWVKTRVAEHGHDVPVERLHRRFPKTQRAIAAASQVADASIFTDNNQAKSQAFTVCRVQIGTEEVFDLRREAAPVPAAIRGWLDVLSPRP